MPPTETTVPAPAPAKPPGRVVVSESSVELLPPIKFFAGSPSILPSSRQTLDAIAATLTGNPSILLVEVRADGSDGPAVLQQRLGDQRAQLIVDELVRRKVDPKRLVAHGVPTGAPGVELEILRRAN